MYCYMISAEHSREKKGTATTLHTMIPDTNYNRKATSIFKAAKATTKETKKEESSYELPKMRPV